MSQPGPMYGVGRYASLSKLLDTRCSVPDEGGNTVDGVIKGFWTTNEGTPQCVVKVAGRAYFRVDLDDVTPVDEPRSSSRDQAPVARPVRKPATVKSSSPPSSAADWAF